MYAPNERAWSPSIIDPARSRSEANTREAMNTVKKVLVENNARVLIFEAL